MSTARETDLAEAPRVVTSAVAPSLHVTHRLPLGAKVEGRIKRAPWYGARVRGIVIGYHLTTLGRWVVRIANSIGTDDLPRNGKVYRVHEENVMRL